MGTIVIKGLRELGVHGVLPEEQTRPQPFEVDVELHKDLSGASGVTVRCTPRRGRPSHEPVGAACGP